MLFRGYRAKLVVYMVLLIIFLFVTFGYSYRYVQQVLLDEVDTLGAAEARMIFTYGNAVFI